MLDLIMSYAVLSPGGEGWEGTGWDQDPRRVWVEVGGEGHTVYLKLNCHHKNDSAFRRATE